MILEAVVFPNNLAPTLPANLPVNVSNKPIIAPLDAALILIEDKIFSSPNIFLTDSSVNGKFLLANSSCINSPKVRPFSRTALIVPIATGTEAKAPGTPPPANAPAPTTDAPAAIVGRLAIVLIELITSSGNACGFSAKPFITPKKLSPSS